MPAEVKKLDIAVLSTSDLGFEVALALRKLALVGRILVVTAPFPFKKRASPIYAIKRMYRMRGLFGSIRRMAQMIFTSKFTRRPFQISHSLPESICHVHVDSLHSTGCLAKLREFRPDLGVVAGTQILKSELFDIPRLGSINLHSGKAPEYRGSAPAFWELYNGEKRVGITIHKVTSSLDAGDIILQELFPIDPAPLKDLNKYIEEYQIKILRSNGIRMLCEAVAQIAQGDAQYIRQDESKAQTFSSPDYALVKEAYRRAAGRLRAEGGRRLFRRGIKTGAGLLFYHTGLDRLIFKKTAAIALFHKVSEVDDGYPLGVSSHLFDEYCSFASKHFDVISLGELVDRINTKKDIGGCMVITFDDGYKDNIEVAAPILAKWGMPACFFITSGFMGTKTQTFWDKAYGITSRWMDWNDIRLLRSQKHEIGAHTINHVNLGKVSAEVAAREIAGSKLHIERELGETIRHFSHPFGESSHITEEARVLVKKSGFSSCLSATEKLVTTPADPFLLDRACISTWYTSPYQSLYRIPFNVSIRCAKKVHPYSSDSEQNERAL